MANKRYWLIDWLKNTPWWYHHIQVHHQASPCDWTGDPGTSRNTPIFKNFIHSFHPICPWFHPPFLPSHTSMINLLVSSSGSYIRRDLARRSHSCASSPTINTSRRGVMQALYLCSGDWTLSYIFETTLWTLSNSQLRRRNLAVFWAAALLT